MGREANERIELSRTLYGRAQLIVESVREHLDVGSCDGDAWIRWVADDEGATAVRAVWEELCSAVAFGPSGELVKSQAEEIEKLKQRIAELEQRQRG